MEPQQARLTFAAFVALSVIIVFNALYMQKDAGFSTRGSQGSALFAERAERTPVSKIDHPQAKGSDLVHAIRRELSGRNYFPGNAFKRVGEPIDAMTMGAIMAYQYDNSLVVTGQATDALLKSFLFGVGEPVRTHDKIPPLSQETHQLVAEIQGILSAKGHYGGKIDGIFKNQTIEAVRRFERDRGLPVTGRISGLLVQELTRSTGVNFLASPK